MRVHTDLLVVEECVFVVDRASCTPTFPLSMEHGLVPGLLQTQQTGVDLERGDTFLCVCISSVSELA